MTQLNTNQQRVIKNMHLILSTFESMQQRLRTNASRPNLNRTFLWGNLVLQHKQFPGWDERQKKQSRRRNAIKIFRYIYKKYETRNDFEGTHYIPLVNLYIWIWMVWRRPINDRIVLNPVDLFILFWFYWLLLIGEYYIVREDSGGDYWWLLLVNLWELMFFFAILFM